MVEVGQWVLVKRERVPVYWLRVSKVGRKWAYFPDGRFDMKTLLIDGGKFSSRGSVFLSVYDFRRDTRHSQIVRFVSQNFFDLLRSARTATLLQMIENSGKKPKFINVVIPTRPSE